MAPAGTPRRPDTRPSLLSPSSRSGFSAAAADDDDAADDEQPSVELLDWWLATVEGDDQKVAVAGTFRLNQILYELVPTPIAKRHSPDILESEDGTILVLRGSLNNLRMLGNGYSDTVCQHFMFGFPRWWQSCNLHYPKLMNSDTGCQPGSSNTSNSGSGVEHLDSYRTSFISKHPDGLRSSSRNDSVFPKPSHLANGTPRFEQHTCDGDIATNETVAASSEAGKGGQRTPVVTLDVQGCREDIQHVELTEKEAVDEEMTTSVYLDVQNTPCVTNGTPILEEYTCDGDNRKNEDAAASNDDNERYTTPSKEVNNVEIGLIAGSPSSERGHDDIATDVPSAPTVHYYTNNAVSEAVESTPATATDHNKTRVACLKNQGSQGKNQHRASNKKPVGRPKKRKISHEKHQNATRERGHDDIATDVSLAPTVQCINNAVSEAVDSTPATATDHSKTRVACLKNQGSQGKNQHRASNKKPVGRPKKRKISHEKHQNATRERGHDDIATDVSLAPTVQCTNNAVSEAVDSTPATATDRNKTRVACLKNQGSRAKNQHRASNKKVVLDQEMPAFSLFRCPSLDCGPQDLKHPVGRPKKQKILHEKHQSATRSHWTRSSVSQGAVDEEMTTSVYLDVQNTLSMSNGTPILEEYTCDRDIPTNEGIPSRERGHDDIANDVSLAPTVQCTNNAVSEAVDSTPATDHNRTPVACLKNQGVMVGKVYKRRAKTSGENRHRASNKKPVGQPKKQKISHEKHQSATRSHETRSPFSQILWSPLTRGKATSLSMSTPEDLKLKRTRSGRLVVPGLNEGCQFIVYGRDRSIRGVVGLDSPAMPKGSELKTYRRNKRTK